VLKKNVVFACSKRVQIFSFEKKKKYSQVIRDIVVKQIQHSLIPLPLARFYTIYFRVKAKKLLADFRSDDFCHEDCYTSHSY
jgi:hypothetical protein